MRIAIIGTGISGLVAAHGLHRTHDIIVFEASDWIGGHTHTLDVECDGRMIPIDTGFIVFNEQNYPNFTALLRQLGVASQPTDMSFSVRCDQTDVEYSGGSFRGLFAQKRNLMRPRFWGMLRDLMRFHREADEALARSDDDLTVREFVRREAYSEEFVQRFLVPMGCSLWSCPSGEFLRFPIRFVVEFFRNHRMLQTFGRPTWRVISGGSRTYVEALIRPFRDRIWTRHPVERVTRTQDAVMIESLGRVHRFDHVILACHADQALQLLSDADMLERETLAAFPFHPNEVVLHTDDSLLPQRRAAWSAWNFHMPDDDAAPFVTYNMNILQSLDTSRTICVSLNATDRIDPAKVIARFTYHHPMYDDRRTAAWRRGEELACRRRTSFCGAYWGYGFHEDGVVSALRVCRAIDGATSASGSAVNHHSYALAETIA